MCNDSLKAEFQYYLDNQDDLVQKHNGKVLAIKDCQIIGAYESAIEALETTSKTHERGTFIVQRCSPGPDDYTVTLHSRASFA